MTVLNVGERMRISAELLKEIKAEPGQKSVTVRLVGIEIAPDGSKDLIVQNIPGELSDETFEHKSRELFDALKAKAKPFKGITWPPDAEKVSAREVSEPGADFGWLPGHPSYECPKCGSDKGWTGPRYVITPSMRYSFEALLFKCAVCGYERSEPVKDAKPVEPVEKLPPRQPDILNPRPTGWFGRIFGY